MTNQEIRDKAPSGATHYSISGVLSFNYYFKVNGEDVWIWTVFKRFEKTLRKYGEYKDLNPL